MNLILFEVDIRVNKTDAVSFPQSLWLNASYLKHESRLSGTQPTHKSIKRNFSSIKSLTNRNECINIKILKLFFFLSGGEKTSIVKSLSKVTGKL